MTGHDGDRARDPFINRECELAELRAGWADAMAGCGRLFLLAGDPGIGKTRLADELCNDATPDGALVLRGRCWEGGGAPAFWPWTQIIRSYFRQCPPEVFADELGAGVAEIARLVPELYDLNPAEPVQQLPGADAARFRLFDAMATLLRATSQTRPILLVIDDLHAADPATVRLLQFVARDLHGFRLLLLGMYRGTEARHDTIRREILAELGRDARVIALRGLPAPDLARFVEARLGRVPDPALVEALYRATSGNPFFVDAVVRLLVAEHQLTLPPQQALAGLRIPEHVREVIRQHLRPLPEATLQLLSVAAVIGHEFDLSVLEQVILAVPSDPAAREQLLDLLDSAVTSGLIAEVAPMVGRYRFMHALIRETLYGDLVPTQRVHVHRAVGEAIERLYGGEAKRLPELAHHFFAALPGGDLRPAITYQMRAGDLAMQCLAYELAAQHFERALQACIALDPPDPERKGDILLALAAALRHGIDTAAARQTLLQAAALGRHVLGSSLLARAEAALAELAGNDERGLQACAPIQDESAQPSDVTDRKPRSDDAAASVTDPQSETRRAAEPVLQKEGDFWALGFAGRTCRVKATRGLDYIAHLMHNPGDEIHVLDLVHGFNGFDRNAAAVSRGAADPSLATRRDTDAGDLLDGQAKAAYKRRLVELREELEDARELNDVGRLERAQAEIDSLLQELHRAIGLGGRPRRAGSHAERARVNVTRAISLALQKIAAQHPSLGGHLQGALKTGVFCVYSPLGASFRVAKSSGSADHAATLRS